LFDIIPQPDTSLHCKTTNTGLVHHAVYLLTPKLLLVFNAHIYGRTAKMDWLGWLVTYRYMLVYPFVYIVADSSTNGARCWLTSLIGTHFNDEIVLSDLDCKLCTVTIFISKKGGHVQRPQIRPYPVPGILFAYIIICFSLLHFVCATVYACEYRQSVVRTGRKVFSSNKSTVTSL